MTLRRWLCTWLFLASAFLMAPMAHAEKLWTYFGTYTDAKSKGIYLGELDLETGELKISGVAGEIESPSFLAIHPSGKYLYAVGEIGNFNGKKAGAVSAFAIEPKTGKLTLLNQQSSEGSGPCHVSIDKTGKCVLVANYGGGSVASLAVGADGKLSEAASSIQHKGSSVDKGRQEGPHAHSINPSPDNRFAFAADLGLDKILIYKLDAAKATLTPNDPAFVATVPGGGPRHFAFHPSGKWAYVCNEMKSSVTSFDYNAEKGDLKIRQTLSTLPEGYDKPGNSTAEVQVHPSGKFVYVSNRGHDSIAGFSIDDEGKIASLGQTSVGGKTPRNFGIDPTGKYLVACGQSSGSVHVFKIDAKSGKLEPVGSKVEVPNPVCVKFLKQ